MNKNELDVLEQKIHDEVAFQLGSCYGEESVRDLHVNTIMKLVRDLRNKSWSAGCKFGEEHTFD